MTDDLPRTLRYERLVAELDLVRGLTRVDGGPHEQVLRGALSGDPDRVSWLVGPTGRALGVGVSGTGAGLANAVAAQVEEMLGETAATAFRGLALTHADAGVDLEMVLGRPAWFRAGVRVETFEGLRSALSGIDAPAEARERILAHESVPGASPEWVGVVEPSPDPGRRFVGTRLPTDAVVGPPARHLGDGSVVVDELVEDPDRSWYRRPGLDDRALIEWQNDREFYGEAAETVGSVQGALGVDGPTRMTWEDGRLYETLVYVYPASVGAD